MATHTVVPQVDDPARLNRAGESQAALHRILGVSLHPISLARKFDAILDLLFDISWLHIERKGAVFLAEPEARRLIMVSNRYLSPVLCGLCAEVPYGHCLCGKAARDRVVVFSSHLDHDHETVYDGIADHGHYCQPIVSNGVLLGVLNLYVAPGHVDQPEERDFLQSVADTLAGIIERDRAERERQRLVTVVEDSPDFVGITDIENRPLYYNRTIRDLLAGAAGEMEHRQIDDLFVDWSARLLREEGIPTALAEGAWKGETSIRLAGGGELPVSHIILAPRDEDDRPRFLATVCRDISDRKKVEETLQILALHEQHFANAVINSLPGIFFTLSGAGHLTRWNMNMEQNLGYSGEQLAGMGLLDLVSEADAARMWQAVEQADNGHAVTLEVLLHSVGGECVSYLVSTTMINPVHGGGVAVIGVGFDISERKALEVELERQASVDYLTGIYNRRKFMELLDVECARSLRYGRPLALFMFDIDHFKDVNDAWGHDVGDHVLREVVRRARNCLRKSDLIARWGGEEFVVLVPEGRADQALHLAEKMRAALNEASMECTGTITASFGVAEFMVGETVDALVKRADLALYRAKALGRDRVEMA